MWCASEDIAEPNWNVKFGANQEVTADERWHLKTRVLLTATLEGICNELGQQVALPAWMDWLGLKLAAPRSTV